MLLNIRDSTIEYIIYETKATLQHEYITDLLKY